MGDRFDTVLVAVENRPVVGHIKSSLSGSIILEIKSSFTRIWLSLKRVWSVSPIITNITKHWLVRISTSWSTEIRNRRRTTICSFWCSWRSALRSCQRRTLNWIYFYPTIRVQWTKSAVRSPDSGQSDSDPSKCKFQKFWFFRSKISEVSILRMRKNIPTVKFEIKL